MAEVDTELPATAPSTSSASSTLPSTVPKKKKRGGKKHKKGSASVTTDNGQVFENNDGWEDVEMNDA